MQTEQSLYKEGLVFAISNLIIRQNPAAHMFCRWGGFEGKNQKEKKVCVFIFKLTYV